MKLRRHSHKVLKIVSKPQCSYNTFSHMLLFRQLLCIILQPQFIYILGSSSTVRHTMPFTMGCQIPSSLSHNVGKDDTNSLSITTTFSPPLNFCSDYNVQETTQVISFYSSLFSDPHLMSQQLHELFLNFSHPQ